MPRIVPDSARCWDLIRLGKIEDIRELLERREMSPYDVAADGVSVLRLAAGALQYDVCALLAQYGAAWMLQDRFGRSAASLVWEAILLYGDLNKDVMALRPLLRDIEDDIDLQISTLHRIVSGQTLLSLEAYLVVNTSELNSQDWLGKTPLMWASHKGDLASVRVLLKYKAKLDIRDDAGKTCLHYAAMGGHPLIVKALIDAGADACMTERFSALPLHAAVFSNNTSVDDFTSMATHLVEAGCDLEHENYRPYTPIFYAVNANNGAYTEALINLKADFNRYSSGMCMTPLSLAILHDRLNALAVLCKHKANSAWVGGVGAAEKDPAKKARAELNDILQMSAVFGSVDAMKMLTQSSLDAVTYEPTRIWNLFRTVRVAQVKDTSPVAWLAAEAALQELLRCKGVSQTEAEAAGTVFELVGDEGFLEPGQENELQEKMTTMFIEQRADVVVDAADFDI